MEENNLALAQELKRVIKGEVRFDPYSRALYSTDASIYQMEPVGLVLPRDADDVAATVRIAHASGVPVLLRGGGTSLAGQCVNHAVVIDTTKYMNRVLEVNPEERWAWTQPGITLDELNAQVAPHGLKFAPDPITSNRGTVGGAVGNNSCGSHSILYGKTVDHILELEVVLSDSSTAILKELAPAEVEAKQASQTLEGQAYREAFRIASANQGEIEQRFPRVMRRVAGYNLDELLKEPANLAKLIVGSEGTLVAVVAAKVNLVPRPRHTVLAALHFHSLVEAMEATVALLDEKPSIIELIDRTILERCRAQVGLSRRMGFVEGDPAALLVVELDGDSQEKLVARLDGLAQRAQRRGLSYACVKIPDQAGQQDVLEVRRAGLGLLMGMKGDTKPLPFVEDTAVSPERLPEYVRRFDEIVRANGTVAAYYAHASVGCLHIRPLINLKLQDGVDRMTRIAEEIADLVLEFDGTLSGEHGDGIVRGVFTEKMFGPQLYGAFRDLKRAFDPAGIMNPGKIIDCPPMTENLRIGPSYRTTSVETRLDFSSDHGFAGSVELCNGVGACRKNLDGTMCPSYMVTREEEHSTRGRANALRSVLSGMLPPSEFTSRRLYQVLDLCLECKGCKAECPSGVDMTKLKYEFLSHYHKANGYTLRDRLFADIARLNCLGSALAPLSNWVAALPTTRWAFSRIGIHPKRRLPAFARPTFEGWFKRHRPAQGAGQRGRVVLFHDTFMNYNEPSVGISATVLLERVGYEVVLVPRWCCGRPMLSKGMLERARQNARQNVELLHRYTEEGIPIVGCEPSCLLMLRDEYLDLLPGDPKAKRVAEGTFLLDEFLMFAHENGGLGVEFRAMGDDGQNRRKVIFQGHCHQKALIGEEAALKLLRMVPGVEVQALDAGCCGMAGAFGFEKEHYELSMQIGERRLFPAVRQDPDAAVVVTGVSCRQQVEHGTGVRALHLAEYLAGALAEQ